MTDQQDATPKLQDIVQAIVTEHADASEDEIVLAVYNTTEFKLTVKDAIAEVRKAKIALGLEKTPAQRKAEFEDAVEASEGFDLANADFVAEALTLGEDLGIPVATAKKYLAAWASELNVTLAVAESKGRTPSNWPAVKTAFEGSSLEELDADKDGALKRIADVVCAPGEALAHTDKKVLAIFARLRKEFGATATTGESKVDKLVTWFKEAYAAGQPTSRKEIVEAGIAAGMTATSAQYYVNVFNITKSLLVDLK